MFCCAPAIYCPQFRVESYRFSASTSPVTLQNQNQRLAYNDITSSVFMQGITAQPLTGKRYFEFKIVSKSVLNHGIGVGVSSSGLSTGFNNSGWYGAVFGGGGCGITAGYWSNGALGTVGSYAPAVGDVIGIAYDSATGQIWFRKNGTWIAGDPVAGTGETATLPAGSYVPCVSLYSCFGGSGAMDVDIYVMPSEMQSAVPSGFSAYSAP